MTIEKPRNDRDADQTRAPAKKGARPPEWANGLRQLYDAVVDEDLPDSFKDLLSKLDDAD